MAIYRWIPFQRGLFFGHAGNLNDVPFDIQLAFLSVLLHSLKTRSDGWLLNESKPIWERRVQTEDIGGCLHESIIKLQSGWSVLHSSKNFHLNLFILNLKKRFSHRMFFRLSSSVFDPYLNLYEGIEKNAQINLSGHERGKFMWPGCGAKWQF